MRTPASVVGRRRYSEWEYGGEACRQLGAILVVGRKRGLAARTRQPSDSVSERLSTATNVFFVLRFPRMHIYIRRTGDIYVLFRD